MTDIKYKFASDDLSRGMIMVKMVKPMSGDVSMQFVDGKLVLFSCDRRRFVKSVVHPVEVIGDASDHTSNEFKVPIGKLKLLDSALTSVVMNESEDSLTINAKEGSQSRRAVIKKRSSISKVGIPQVRVGEGYRMSADVFAKLLRAVSCSALVKETKTEEEMRVNQIHFHADGEFASSNSRFYASVVHKPGMKLDLSIVSTDVPVMRAFCGKSASDVVLFQDKTKMYVTDATTGSILVTGRVAIPKPDFKPIDMDGFGFVLKINRENFKDSLDWAVTTLDGTQRLHFETNDENLVMTHGPEEIATVPVSIIKGTRLSADFPARFLSTIVDHVESEEILLNFSHKEVPTVLAVIGTDDYIMKTVHYVQSMRGR